MAINGRTKQPNQLTPKVNTMKTQANVVKSNKAALITPIATVKAKPKAKPEAKLDDGAVVLSIEDAVKQYKSIRSQRKGHLVKMRAIGALFLTIREEHQSNNAFSEAVKETPLSVVTRFDRNDMMWLASNWDKTQAFMAEKSISASSVSYLRKAMKKAEKAEEIADEPATKGDKVASTDKSTKGGETGSHPKRDVVDIAKTVIAECNNNGVTVKQLITALQNQLKAK